MDKTMLHDKKRLFYRTGKIVYGDRFVGRKDLLSEMQDCVINLNDNLAVMGMPRVGKSSLVWQCFMFNKEEIIENDNMIPIFCETGSVTSEKDYIDLFFSASYDCIADLVINERYQTIKKVYDNYLKEDYQSYKNANTQTDENNAIKSFYKHLKIFANYSIILILDEFDHVHNFLTLRGFQLLREISYNPDSGVCIVTTSRKSIKEIEPPNAHISNFHGTFEHMYVGMYNQDDLIAYWSRVENSLGIPTNVKNQINDIVGGHPYFTDLCCLHYYSSENEDNILNQSLKLKLFNEFSQIISILERDNLLKPAIQIVVGPLLENIPDTTVIRMKEWGLIKEVSNKEKASILGSSFLDDDEDDNVYILFGSFFSRLFYAKYLLDTPYWPLWGETENKLREIVKKFVVRKFGEDWYHRIKEENKYNFDWLDRFSSMEERYNENKDLPIYSGYKSIIDFAETGQIYHLFIKKYWNVAFANIFKATLKDQKEAQKNNIEVDAFLCWQKRFTTLIVLRRPYAHNNSQYITEEDINTAKFFCRETLDTISKWEELPESEKSNSLTKSPAKKKEKLYGVYIKKRNVVEYEGRDRTLTFIVISKKEELYDEADVVFEIEQDKKNPKRKYAVNVAIKD